MIHRFPKGEYSGETVRRIDAGDLHVMEIHYPPLLEIAPHFHELPSFCIVLSGGYDETSGRSDRRCGLSTMIFHPEGEIHSDRHGDLETRLLCVELGSGRAEAIRQLSPIIDTPVHFPSGPTPAIGVQICAEFLRNDDLSPLAIEGLVLETYAAASRQIRPDDGRTPAWLSRAEDLLHTRFSETISLSEIASTVDVHPVHLARGFRRKHRCTVGDYVRRLRVEAACGLLARSTQSIGQVALAVGFADQSHFTRNFKSAKGVTPGEYRRSFASRSGMFRSFNEG